MSTAPKKARRRSGIPFTKAQKTPTPLEDRAFITQPVFRRGGDAHPIGLPAGSTERSPRRAARFLLNGGRP
jgi:hypothetical protein